MRHTILSFISGFKVVIMRKLELLLPVGMFSILVFFGIWHVIDPDRTSSEMENRTLTTFSRDFSVDKIVDGSRLREFETYYTDQFVLRDTWMKGYKQLQLSSGKPFVENYHASPGGWIVSIPVKKIPEELMMPKVKALQLFSENLETEGIEFSFWSLPAKASYIRTPVPSYMSEDQGIANNNSFLSLMEENGVKPIKLYEKMTEDFPIDNPREWFFQTDHHWNMNGAFKAYQTIINTYNLKFGNAGDPLSQDEVSSECLSNREFAGSWNKQLYMLVQDHHDQICYLEPQNPSFDEQFTIYKGEMRKENIIERSEIFATGIKEEEEPISFAKAYSFDYGELHFINKAPKTDQRVLMIKDSYLNPIQYHMASHFAETTIVDLRYFGEYSLLNYIKKNDFDHVMMLYNDRNFDDEIYILD